MDKNKYMIWAVLVLGLISSAWLVLDFAALTDIFHGREPNLAEEWQVVSWSILPLGLFHLASILTLFKTVRHFER